MMKPETLELLVTRSMPFGKYQGRLIADLPGTTWHGSRAKDSRQGNWVGCWR